MNQPNKASAYPLVPAMWAHQDLRTGKYTAIRQVATKPKDDVLGKKWVPLYTQAGCCTAQQPIAA